MKSDSTKQQRNYDKNTLALFEKQHCQFVDSLISL